MKLSCQFFGHVWIYPESEIPGGGLLPECARCGIGKEQHEAWIRRAP